MPNDQFGRPISVGDTVTIKGEVVKVLDDPNFINCTVKLSQKMPPAGTTTNLELNTAQLEKTGGSKTDEGQHAHGGQLKSGPPPGTSGPPHEQVQQQEPSSSRGAKK